MLSNRREDVSFEVRLALAPVLATAMLQRAAAGLSITIVCATCSLASGLVPMVALAVIATALILHAALARGRVPLARAHDIGVLAWLLAPITTLSTLATTPEPDLALLLMIEIAIAALLLDTVRMVVASGLVMSVSVMMLWLHAGSPVHALAVIPVWIVSIVVHLGDRRSRIVAEDLRLRAQQELASRRIAEAERERLHEQLLHAQRIEAVGALSAGLAHDMNNILGGILGFAQLLHEDTDDPRTRADLASIAREAERGAQLTRSLLAFCRRDPQSRKQVVQLDDIIDDLMPMMSQTIGKRVRIARVVSTRSWVDGDPALLGQAVINLCINAADAMEGTGTLTVQTSAVTLAPGEIHGIDGGAYAKLSVADTGHGMDEATRQRIFEPFFTTKATGKGTGLGLAIVHRTVRDHGGFVDVETAPGKGTTFHIYLPAVPPPRRSELANGSHAMPAIRGLVLVVDHEPASRMVACRMLAKHRFSPIAATSDREAVEACARHRHELAAILLDVSMAGPELVARLRQQDPKLPILLMSGYADPEAMRDLLAAGATSVLAKPFTSERLRAELDRFSSAAN